MSIPEKYLTIMNKFAQALKTGDLSEVNAIPLDDVKLARIHLNSDSTQPYYSLLLHTIKEREKATLDSKEGVKVSGVESNYAKNQHIFLAYKFADDDLVIILKKTIERHKYLWAEGKKNDLGKISADILAKIKNCGFFIAILTKQHELQGGNFTTNSWLIEEKGAALAFGQRPLVMVEEGIERHYVGFVQNDDQIIYFNMADFSTKAEDVIKRIDATYIKYLGQDLI
ncbi:MAG: hypothetical protein ABSF79_02305 [Smithellaceae bacterium]|jgi:hypothetical protein